MKLTKPIAGILCFCSFIGYANLDTLQARDQKSDISFLSGDNIPDEIKDVEVPEQLKKQAQIAATRGIPPSITIAIAYHETGGFKAIIGEGNYYGIKCVDSESDPCTSVKTRESYCTGLCEQSFQVGKNNKFVANVFANTLINLAGLEGQPKSKIEDEFQDVENILNRIGRRYATDPNWAKKVIAILLK